LADTLTAEQQLWRRVEDALGGHDVDWPDRAMIQEGWLTAGGPSAKWDDLTPEVQQKIEFVESLPPTSWDDPADAPDDLD
jgi:hypothetical protein